MLAQIARWRSFSTKTKQKNQFAVIDTGCFQKNMIEQTPRTGARSRRRRRRRNGDRFRHCKKKTVNLLIYELFRIKTRSTTAKQRSKTDSATNGRRKTTIEYLWRSAAATSIVARLSSTAALRSLRPPSASTLHNDQINGLGFCFFDELCAAKVPAFAINGALAERKTKDKRTQRTQRTTNKRQNQMKRINKTSLHAGGGFETTGESDETDDTWLNFDIAPTLQRNVMQALRSDVGSRTASGGESADVSREVVSTNDAESCSLAQSTATPFTCQRFEFEFEFGFLNKKKPLLCLNESKRETGRKIFFLKKTKTKTKIS